MVAIFGTPASFRAQEDCSPFNIVLLLIKEILRDDHANDDDPCDRATMETSNFAAATRC